MATAGDSRSFLVRVHHGGKFVRDPGLRYSNGEMEDYEIFDIDKLNYRRIVNMVAQVGYGNYPRLWWLRPGGKIDCDLIYFYDDSGMHQLLNTMKNGETIDMYCEHAVDHPEIINQLTDADSHNVEVMGDYEDLGYFDIDVDIGPNTDDENEELASAREKKKTYAEEQKAEDLESSDEEDTVEPEVVSSNPDRAVLEEVGSDIEYQNVDDGYESIDEEADNQGNSVLRVKKTRKVLYNPNVNAQSFLVGMVFKNMKEFKLACTKYSILRGVDIDFVRNEKDRVRAVCCFKNCPWLCFASKEGNTGDVKIKKYIPKHMCMKSFTNRRITSKYLAFHLREVIENKPSIRVTVLREMAKQDLKFEIGYYMVKRAKQQVLQETKGNYVKEYATLHDYAQEIRETNIGSTVVVLPIRGTNQFDFFYVCFDALKKGWKQGCRPVIGMDGCFLKTECGGQLLTAVGRDGNDQQFPIAWAVVKVENKQTWTWFIKLLKTDLEITDGDGLVVVTDMQKGLLPAVKENLPNAEHRWCAMHVFANWRKRWRTIDLKNCFWKTAKSTYYEKFLDCLEELDGLAPGCVNDLLVYPPHTWCRAFQKFRSKSDVIDNNMCESFNSIILDARELHILSMLEKIRKDLMVRNSIRMTFSNKWISNISPSCISRLQSNMERAFKCKMIWNGDKGFEISERKDAHTITVANRSCTCRFWDLTGIPCPHGICALYHGGLNLEDCCDDWYKKEKFIKAYSFPLQPLKDEKQYPRTGLPPLEPPQFQKPRGRPKKNRRKEPDEPKKAGKLSKKGISIKCSVCREYGHNKNGCKNRVKAQTNQTSGNPTSENLNQSDAEIAKEYYFHYEKPENVPSSENIVQDLLTRAANKESQTTSKDQEHKEASTKKKKNAKEPTGIIFEGGRASIDSVFFLENFHKEKVSYDKEQMRTIGLVQPPASYQGNPSYGRFKSPGLRWDGSPAVTVNQLQADVERAKRSRNPSDETQAAMASQSKEGNQTTDAQRTHKMQKTRPTWRP